MDNNMGLALYRLDRAKEELNASDLLFKGNFYKSANNRAYYSIFHAIRAILALERKDFKRHKSVVAYFNENYVKTEIFPKKIGRRIALASRVREESDYDDEFVVSPEETLAQMETAKYLIDLVEQYLQDRS